MTFFFKNQIISVLGEGVAVYSKYLIFILPLAFCYVYQSLLEAILATKFMVVLPSFLKHIFRRLVLMMLYALYFYQKIDLYQLMFIYVLAHFVELLILYTFFKQHFHFKLEKPKLYVSSSKKREIIIYALYLVVGVSGLVIVSKVDSVMIGGIMSDFKLLGVYSIAFFIATIIEIPRRIIHQLITPVMAKLVSEGKNEELGYIYKQAGKNLAIIGVFIFLLIWYSIDELFLIIPNGEIYSAGKWVVFFIGISKVLDVIFWTSDIMINVTKYYKWNGILSPLLIATAFISNYIFIHLYGIEGAAIATCLTAVIFSIVKCYFVIFTLKWNLLSKSHLYILGNLIVVVLIFTFKPRFLDNNFYEIVVNSVLITIIFIGGNFLMKSSSEMNELVITGYKKIIRKS